jgi:hypothetical protein
MRGAEAFSLIRSYLSTCRKKLIASEALRAPYDQKLFGFISVDTK